jgi:hypothetical protein
LDADEDSDEPYDEEAASYRLYGRSPGTAAAAARPAPHRCVVLAPRTAAAAAEEQQLALALALSLSMCDAATSAAAASTETLSHPLDAHHLPCHASYDPAAHAVHAAREADLSYEALVQLEDVRPVAPQSAVDALPTPAFDAAAHGGVDARCAICLEQYTAGEELLLLPCSHVLHGACGRTLLLSYSKRCPEAACRRSVLPWDTHD